MVKYDDNDNAHLTTIFHDSLGKLVPERLHSGCYLS